MRIEFENEQTCTVYVPCAIVDENTGEVFSGGERIYTIEYRLSDDPGYCPDVKSVQSGHKLAKWPLGEDVCSIIDGTNTRYRIDLDGPSFQKILESADIDWWREYGEHYFVYDFETLHGTRKE